MIRKLFAYFAVIAMATVLAAIGVAAGVPAPAGVRCPGRGHHPVDAGGRPRLRVADLRRAAAAGQAST